MREWEREIKGEREEDVDRKKVHKHLLNQKGNGDIKMHIIAPTRCAINMLHILSHYISCTRLPTQSRQCQKSNSAAGATNGSKLRGLYTSLSFRFYVVVFFYQMLCDTRAFERFAFSLLHSVANEQKKEH